jgi:Peptidase family M23
MTHAQRCLFALLVVTPSGGLYGQNALPPLPDTTGWGVHVLAAEKAPDGSVWVGTYGRGIYRLRPNAGSWEHIESDTTAGSISWDFVHAFGFGPKGEIWYGTVGNGWGVSVDDGKTWKNWTFDQLGPEWQYVAPQGIVTLGDTTYIGTADGIQVTTDNGAHWMAFIDSVGPAARGPADTALVLMASEYVRSLWAMDHAVYVVTLKGDERVYASEGGWLSIKAPGGNERSHPIQFSSCGLVPAKPCLEGGTRQGVRPPSSLLTTWFRRPIDSTDNWYIDQTYRYGSTMGGNFQQHQGVEFNNQDGTPVHAIGDGTVVYSGRAERGALTVAIRHDTTVTTPQGRLFVHSVYYHNNELIAKVGDRVNAGDVISRVGHTGRATNDHLHLEVHASPTDSVSAIVDSLNRFPAYTTNPELWIQPLPGTGIVAGQVFDSAGQPIPQARVYGLTKEEPRETPYSFAETYGNRAHPHPAYGEHFAVGDVPPGEYVLGVEIAGKKELRRIRVEAGRLTWVEFRPSPSR